MRKESTNQGAHSLTKSATNVINNQKPSLTPAPTHCFQPTAPANQALSNAVTNTDTDTHTHTHKYIDKLCERIWPQRFRNPCVAFAATTRQSAAESVLLEEVGTCVPRELQPANVHNASSAMTKNTNTIHIIVHAHAVAWQSRLHAMRLHTDRHGSCARK